MIRRILAVAAFILVLASLTAPVAIAEPHERNGFFIGFGLGGGYATWDWEDQDVDDSGGEGSGVGQFRIGGALRDDLLLAFESSAWVKDYDVELAGDDIGSATLTFNASTFAATWFPGNMGWYLRGGVGFATVSSKVEIDALDSAKVTIEQTDNGFAALGASGYEWRFTRKFAVGPQVEVFFLTTGGDLVDNVFVVDGAVEFNWYW